MFRTLLILTAVFGCAASKQQPALRVINTPSHEVVFVQVTNTAKRPMRLSKLEYSIGDGKSTVSEGELELHEREIPAGAMAVVEVPLEHDVSRPTTLRGKLTAELDQMMRTFKVSAEIQPE